MKVEKYRCRSCPKIKSLLERIAEDEDYRDSLIEKLNAIRREAIDAAADNYCTVVVNMMEFAQGTENAEIKRACFAYIQPLNEVLNRYANGEPVSLKDFFEAHTLGAIDVEKEFGNEGSSAESVIALSNFYNVNDQTEEIIMKINEIIEPANTDIQQMTDKITEMTVHCSGP